MEAIKISVDVNINFGEDAKQLVLTVVNAIKNQVGTMPAPAPAAQAPKPAPALAPKPAPASAPAPAPKPAPAPAPAPEATVTIDDVRIELAKKVDKHREAIKAKLGELGAPSVTKLDPSKYNEMLDFLTSLA